MKNEGYLLLATGPSKYVDMARNLAASIRAMDGRRPICLVHDEQHTAAAADSRYFDDYAVLPADAAYPGFMNKIRLYPISPYRRSMFIDADCLMVKRDIDAYWEMTRPFPFGITGARRTSGEWKGADIAQLLAQEGAPYLIQMNSGVFTFDKCPQSEQFFSGLMDYYQRRQDKLGVGLHRGRRAQTDEIYIGLWMGLNSMESCGGRIDENSWMVSTWRAFQLRIDVVDGRSTISKPRHSIARIPNPLMGWDTISPTLVHFIELKPRREYERVSRYFRSKLESDA